MVHENSSEGQVFFKAAFPSNREAATVLWKRSCCWKYRKTMDDAAASTYIMEKRSRDALSWFCSGVTPP